MSLSSADIKAEDAVRLPGNYATVGGANVEVRNKLQQLLKSNSQQQSSSFSIGDVTPSDDSDNGDANDKTQGTTGKKAPTEKQKSYVVMDTGGVQNASKFMESTEDQRYLTRHFPELALEQIRGVSSCALEKDVLWHGKLIFTNKHLCFRGKLFAKAVKLVVPFNDILAIEKKSTVLIPNAIRIVTLHAKHVLTSIIKRDTLYHQLKEIWKQELKFNTRSAAGEGNTSSKLLTPASSMESMTLGRKPVSLIQSELSSSGKATEVQTSNLSLSSFPEGMAAVGTESNSPEPDAPKRRPVSSSGAEKKEIKKSLSSSFFSKPTTKPNAKTPLSSSTQPNSVENLYQLSQLVSINETSPPPATANQQIQVSSGAGVIKYSCQCKSHLKHTIHQEVFEGVTASQLLHLLFMKQGGEFMENLHKTRGNQGYTFADWTSSSNNECLASRELQYQAQFKAPMMPLSHTKCFDRQSIKQSEGNFVYVVEQRTKTPGVPYGESFEIVNLYCITQETERSTRLLVTMQVHFLKSLFWESMVDKNATEGITGFFKELVSQAKQRLASAEFLSTLPSVAPDFLKTKSSDLPVAQVTDKTASDAQQQTIEQTTEPLFSRIQQSFLNSISIRNISIALFIFMTLLSLNTMSRLSRQNAVVQEISSRIQVPDSQLRTWMSEYELYGDKAGQKSTNEFKKSQLEEIGRLVDIIKEELWIQEKFVELLISHSTPTQMDERT